MGAVSGPSGTGELKRHLGVFDAVVIGLGSMTRRIPGAMSSSLRFSHCHIGGRERPSRRRGTTTGAGPAATAACRPVSSPGRRTFSGSGISSGEVIGAKAAGTRPTTAPAPEPASAQVVDLMVLEQSVTQAKASRAGPKRPPSTISRRPKKKKTTTKAAVSKKTAASKAATDATKKTASKRRSSRST